MMPFRDRFKTSTTSASDAATCGGRSAGCSGGGSSFLAPSSNTASTKTSATASGVRSAGGFLSLRASSSTSNKPEHSSSILANPTTCAPTSPAGRQGAVAAAVVPTGIAVVAASAAGADAAATPPHAVAVAPYRPPMLLEGGGNVADVGAVEEMASAVLCSILGCLLPPPPQSHDLAPAAAPAAAVAPGPAAPRVIPFNASVPADVALQARPPVAAAGGAPTPQRLVRYRPVPTVNGARAPRVVPFQPHMLAAPPPVVVVQPKAHAAAVVAAPAAPAAAAPRRLLLAPVGALTQEHLQQHNKVLNRVAGCMPQQQRQQPVQGQHQHQQLPAVAAAPVRLAAAWLQHRQSGHMQQVHEAQKRLAALLLQQHRAKMARHEAAVQEAQELKAAHVGALVRRYLSGAPKPFELIRLKRRLGEGSFGAVSCWEAQATSSPSAFSTSTSDPSASIEVAVKTCALDLNSLAVGGDATHEVAIHAREAEAALAVQALDYCPHLVRVLGAYTDDALAPGEVLPAGGDGVPNLRIGRIVMEVAEESLLDVLDRYKRLAVLNASSAEGAAASGTVHSAAGAAAAGEHQSPQQPQYRLPETAVRVVLASVLLGLRDLHTRTRLAHRDLKLANLLIGRDGLVKITDLGLATPLDEQGRLVCDVGYAWGTKGYQAPETLVPRSYAEGERELPSWPTANSDVYSVAVIGAALVCGEESGPVMDAFRSSGELPRHCHASPALRQLLKGMVAADPSARLGVEAALAHPALRRVLRGDSARPFSW
ncbi:hypothetical protein HYH02_013143 [Chlamydomonas schloesseri]|uniref:Protein kinase domain-containing protein n=1 Tax=Chlamydomonas schloesseri TaxID=2026947 RepID=A0A835VZZ8_9CHLO|nr:hypothetical protein HYH02_013143 [Chlamydomonas schloesseri]|eukprot:KAG2431924.1 hypothetical protein HYH02_013143 [Chlamydomonas schloesseri]